MLQSMAGRFQQVDSRATLAECEAEVTHFRRIIIGDKRRAGRQKPERETVSELGNVPPLLAVDAFDRYRKVWPRKFCELAYLVCLLLRSHNTTTVDMEIIWLDIFEAQEEQTKFTKMVEGLTGESDKARDQVDVLRAGNERLAG